MERIDVIAVYDLCYEFHAQFGSCRPCSLYQFISSSDYSMPVVWLLLRFRLTLHRKG